ncbi:hypothetical protein ABZ646_41060, partial [Streptomyces sp. NPDC007162]|uniref:hypothetical protein n=1 Tax=Streptomyces sp. NPDC007162 TaxID=3156917 RepID=UPI003409846A
ADPRRPRLAALHDDGGTAMTTTTTSISPQLAPTIGLVEEQPEWADDLADQLYTALHSEQPQAAPADAVPVAMPLTQSLEDDVRQLAQLSDAVRRRVLAGTEHTD